MHIYHTAVECRDLATRTVPSVVPTVVTTTTTNPFPSGMYLYLTIYRNNYTHCIHVECHKVFSHAL